MSELMFRVPKDRFTYFSSAVYRGVN